MVVLKVGDWVLDGDLIGRVVAGQDKLANGFVLVEFYEPDDYLRRETIHPTELTKLDEGLNQILSDSITYEEK